MAAQVGVFVVIETGPAKARIIQTESEFAYEMQAGARIGAEPDDISGVGRDFRLVERDVDPEGHRY